MSCVCVHMHVCNIQKHHGKSAAEAETVTGPGRRPVLGTVGGSLWKAGSLPNQQFWAMSTAPT